jgi:DNA-directed RNA polymerase subunit RPC12/RpoP
MVDLDRRQILMPYPTLTCPACGEAMEPRETHHGKPYYHCDPCGTQVFVRRQEGIKRLEDRGKRPPDDTRAFPW